MCSSIPLIMILLAGTASCSCWMPAEDQWRRQYAKFLQEFMRAGSLIGIYDLDCYPLLATRCKHPLKLHKHPLKLHICSLRGGMLSEPTLKRRKTIAECNVTVVNGSNTIKRRMEWMLPPSAAKIHSRASSKGMSSKSSLEHMRSDCQARLPAHSSKQQQIDQQLRLLQVTRLLF
jgi:hypothetical protein